MGGGTRRKVARRCKISGREMVRTSRLPTGELLARTKGAAQHSIEREAIAPSGVLACGMSAYVRLRAQAGVSSKRRIYSDERLSRAAMVKSQCLPTGEYVSPQDIESGCVAKVDE